MSDYNEYEYTVAQKPEGKWKRRRFLMVLGYVIFGLLAVLYRAFRGIKVEK